MNCVRVTSFLGVFLLFFLSATPVFAKLYINEFSSSGTADWVEIYNDGTTTVDLASFRLRDSTETNKFDLAGSINPGHVLVFDWYNKLNKAGDTIRLLHLPEESLEDQIGYGDHGSDISEITEGSTGGRKTDGGSSWVMFSPGTKGLPNAEQEPLAQIMTLTPVPTLSLTPTKVPTPTKTPTPTKSPTPTRTPTPTKVSTTSSKINESSDDSYPTSSQKKHSVQPTSVLGVSTKSAETKSPSPTPKNTLVKDASVKKEDMSWIFILIGGSTLLVCAILTFFIRRRRLRNEL